MIVKAYHSTELYHYGVIGMKWGVRRNNPNSKRSVKKRINEKYSEDLGKNRLSGWTRFKMFNKIMKSNKKVADVTLDELSKMSAYRRLQDEKEYSDYKKLTKNMSNDEKNKVDSAFYRQYYEGMKKSYQINYQQAYNPKGQDKKVKWRTREFLFDDAMEFNKLYKYSYDQAVSSYVTNNGKSEVDKLLYNS